MMMGYLYIILSMLCRFDWFQSALGSLKRRQVISLPASKRHSAMQSHTFWIPIAGWYTVWTSGNLEDDSHFRIVRIERGLPQKRPQPFEPTTRN